jgi:ATP-binding cassette, subfamily F, member 3
MASVEIAEEIRSIFPGTEELIVQYLSGYLVDDAGEEEDVLQVANDILDSLGMSHPDDVKRLMARLRDLLAEQLSARARNSGRPKLMKLDKVMDMSKVGAMSNTIGLGEGVDLESINKGK